MKQNENTFIQNIRAKLNTFKILLTKPNNSKTEEIERKITS